MKLEFLICLHRSTSTLASEILIDSLPLAGLADAVSITPLEWASNKMPDRYADRREERSLSIEVWKEMEAVDQVRALPGHQNRKLIHPVMGALALKSEPVEPIPGPRLVRGDSEDTEVLQ